MATAPVFTAADYQAEFLALLPVGPLWPRDPDAVMGQFIGSLTPTYARICARDSHLLEDAFPVAPVELLPEWELTLGLPDPCAGPAPTLELRQQQVAARFIASGGQSRPYMIAVAAALGYSITITEYSPSRFGRAFGLPFGGAPWAFAWRVNAAAVTVRPFRFGDSFGEPFSSWGNAVLECEIIRLAPAHTVVLFSYGGVINELFVDGYLLCLADYSWPGPAGLGAGAFYINGRVCSAMPGATFNPAAQPLFFGTTSSAALLAINNGGDLPWTMPTPGSGQLWLPGGAAGGFIAVA